MKNSINKILLSFYYWWYVSIHNNEYAKYSQASTGDEAIHYNVQTRYEILIRDIKYWLHTNHLPVPIYLWLLNHNPFHIFEMNVSFATENLGRFGMFELTELIVNSLKIVGVESSGSGYGCGVRDIHLIGKKSQILSAVKIMKSFEIAYPEWELCITDEINDAEYLGVGY